MSSRDGFQRCSTLSGILQLFNGVIGSEDCLLLELERGEYVISPITTVSVNYSLVMVAASGGGGGEVVVACKSSQAKSSSCAGEIPPWTFSKVGGGERSQVSVVLDGLKFEDCARPIQFDNLDRVAISNCWFR